jgi:hypothetical protein
MSRRLRVARSRPGGVRVVASGVRRFSSYTVACVCGVRTDVGADDVHVAGGQPSHEGLRRAARGA